MPIAFWITVLNIAIALAILTVALCGNSKWAYQIGLPGCVVMGLDAFALAWLAPSLLSQLINICVGVIALYVAWGWVRSKREKDKFEKAVDDLEKAVKDIEAAAIKKVLWPRRN